MSTDSRSAHDRILDTAGALFYRHGYRAIGVDRVIAEAGVAKATFYKHFPSKDDLIAACIGRAEAMTAAATPPPVGPAPLSDWIDAMLRIAGQPTCMGCAHQVSAAEFVDPAHPAHAAALAVKRRLLADLAERARSEGLTDPEAAAERTFLLMEGIWAARRMFGPEVPLTHARAAFRQLLA